MPPKVPPVTRVGQELAKALRKITGQSRPEDRIKPEVGQDLRNFYTSPTADSLFRTGGLPNNLGQLPSYDEGIAGRYREGNDKLSMSELPGTMDRRFVLAHELGHRADRTIVRNRHRSDSDARFNYPSGYELRVTRDGLAPAVIDAIDKIDPYASTDPREASASAYAKAYEFLTAQSDWKNRQERVNNLGLIEARNPGTGVQVERLLGNKMFRNHPAQSLLNPRPK